MHIYVFQEDNYLSKKKDKYTVRLVSTIILLSFLFFQRRSYTHMLLLFSIFKIGKKTGNLFW